MLKVLMNGRSGLNSNQNRLDMISNNIANVETNGYKRADVSFQDTFYDALDKRLGLPMTGTEEERKNSISGSGSKTGAIVRDYNQGIISETLREDDIAIEGKGYFKLKDNNGDKVYYTRDGSFNIDKNGNFVHSSGMVLDIENFDSSKVKRPIQIDGEGNISSGDNSIGKISLYDFVDRESMVPSGDNLFTISDNNSQNVSKVEDSSEYRVKQGFLEKSNVDIARELTDMMVTQRAFELNSRSIKAADEMWQIANNLRGR
jgi:flagellar basal-body rod protein FlgG